MTHGQTLSDTRLHQRCALCGVGAPATRDHVPPKVFLDDPLPAEVPVVRVCQECNGGASLDEEYVACIIDVALCGGVDKPALRPKVTAALAHTAALNRQIAASARRADGHSLGFECDPQRLRDVIAKTGRGLLAYEDADGRASDPVDVSWSVADALEMPTTPQLLPEVGSLGLTRLTVQGFDSTPWVTLQPGRFNYLVDRTLERTQVRMVFSDYLHAECTFTARARR